MVFKNAFRLFKQLKLFLIPIVLFTWISSIFEHYLIQKIEAVINSSDPSTLTLITIGSFHLLNGIIFPTLITLLALSRIRNDRMQPSLPYQIEVDNAQQLFIETLRSWGQSIWWFFALIVPGIYKFMSFSYVPHVVFLNSEYDRGEIDALKASESQFRKRIFATIFVFLLFNFVFPIMLSSFLDSYKDFYETPLLALLVSALNGFLALFSFLLLAVIYLQDNPIRTPADPIPAFAL